jgi:SdpI/YfhL protein family
MGVENIIFGIMYVFIGLLLMGISIPLKNGKVEMNHFYGVRLRKSYTSEKNWYLMNAYGGKQLLIWSGVLVIIGMVTFLVPFNGDVLLIVLFAFMPLVFLLIPMLLIVRYSRTLGDN